MKWYHRVNPDWYKARKNFLTASDIKNLWPKTKTGRNREVSELNYAKIFFEKTQEVRYEDCDSYDWAARGHILEPYAVDEFNQNVEWCPELYQWDDCIITNRETLMGYSPDALDLAQIEATNGTVSVDCHDVLPNVLGEVKSYNAAKHIETIMAPLEQTEERIQIATAMYVSPSINKGYLILYNPEVENVSLAWKCWTRDQLNEELEIINDIAKQWKAFVEKMCSMNIDELKTYCMASYAVLGTTKHYSMNDIMYDYMQQQEEGRRLNPPC